MKTWNEYVRFLVDYSHRKGTIGFLRAEPMTKRRSRAVTLSSFAMVSFAVWLATCDLGTFDSFGAQPSADYFEPPITDVSNFVVQPDGRIVVFGDLESDDESGRGLYRLNADGSRDMTFAVLEHINVTCLALQPDRKILVGGFFDEDEVRHTQVLRLNPDGTEDSDFTTAELSLLLETDEGPWDLTELNCLRVQLDGKILVAGNFWLLCGERRVNVGRLNPNGTLDSTFAPELGYDDIFSYAQCLAVQPDGKIVTAGEFFVSEPGTKDVIRLTQEGQLDDTFEAVEFVGPIHCVTLTPQGQVLVGGAFDLVDDQERFGLAKLKSDGTLDKDYIPELAGAALCVVMQADGKTIVGLPSGSDYPIATLVRLNSKGNVDPEFSPEVVFDPSETWGFHVDDLALQQDGKLLVGGNFVILGGCNRNGFGRLDAQETPVQGLRREGSRFFWDRDGSCPEIYNAVFERSADGTNWTYMGTGTRTATGWASPAEDGGSARFVRARGDTGAGSYVESYLGPPILLSEPMTKSVDMRSTVHIPAAVVGSAPLSYQWLKDGMPLHDDATFAGTRGATLIVSNFTALLEGNYSVMVTNNFGTVTETIAVLSVTPPRPGELDPSFAPRMDGNCYSFAVQFDGKILVSGDFGTVNGHVRTNIARLEKDGALDMNFNPRGADSGVFLLLPDYNIAVCDTERIQVLRPEGTLFNQLYTGADDCMFAFALQENGKLLLGGWFTTLCGEKREALGRLEVDGTLDLTYNPGADDTVADFVQAPGGKVLVEGSFTRIAGRNQSYIARLNQDGSFDDSFTPITDGDVYAVVLQSDGRMLVAGDFTRMCGAWRDSLARLEPDGTLDDSFNPKITGGEPSVSSLCVQCDGRIIITGDFTEVEGQSRFNLARLNPDGSLDEHFRPDPAPINHHAVTLQPDGQILVALVTNYAPGIERQGMARLRNDPATETLMCDRQSITWLRGGTAPEVWRTEFDVQQGDVWHHLGAGTRIPGGWELAGLALHSHAVIRARGWVTTNGQEANECEWFVESVTLSGAIPALSVSCESDVLLISWPSSERQMILQESDSLSPAEWTPVKSSPTLQENIWSVRVKPTGAARFYRLLSR